MRNVCLRILSLALSCAAIAVGTMEANGQQVTELVRFTNTWRYNQAGQNLGVDWRASGYADTVAPWQSGPALLAVEASPLPGQYGLATITGNTIPTPLSLTTGTGTGGTNGTNIAYYFRTSFNNPVSPTTVGLELWATNLVDDGCVIYLNGSEVGRLRVPANQNYLTFASGGPATEGLLEPLNLGTARLLQGNNVLAVEVHQVGAAGASSDIAWAMRLVAITPAALSITSQPQSQTLAVGEPLLLSVGVSGGPVTYRWFKDGVIQPSTSNTINITSVQVGNAGNYQAVVSNILGAVSSTIATVAVVQDTDGPRMLAAIIDNTPVGGTSSFGSNSINVLFDETLGAISARSTNNYRLVSSTNANIQIPILSILYSSALGALLNVDTNSPDWSPQGSYYLVVNNVADFRGNNINPNSVISVSALVTTNLTSMSDSWDYYNSVLFDGTFPDIYRNTINPWYGTNYVVDFSGGLCLLGCGG